MTDGINLAALYPRERFPDRLSSWYNVSNFNGTTVSEGGQSLDSEDFFFQIIVANNIAVAALTLYIWEWLSTLPDEYRLYSRHKLTSRHVFLFLLVRYGTLPPLILPAFSVWHDFTTNMQGCLVHQQLAICVVQLIVSIVFAWRTIAIWDHQRNIVIFFIGIVCIQFGASFGLLWFSEEKILPNGSCMPVTPPNGFNPLPIFYAIAFGYDLLTLLMSSYRLWRFSLLGRQRKEIQPVKWNIHSIRVKISQNYKEMTESPLIQRLTYAGLLYFLVGASFNAVAFALEISRNVHSKALITLYAPLMCILCQRIILLDVKTIWGDLDKHSNNNGSREQALVDRVMNERRLSWQGSEDSSVKSPQLNSPSSEKQSPAQHITVQMDSTTSGVMGFQDMLQDSPANQSSSMFNRHASVASPSQESSSLSSDAGAGASMNDDNRATALRLAGFIK